MPKVDRRERERAEFREEVLAAARKIVLEEGFDALTMRKIADAIEYAPGTIYLYFESRDAIAFELCLAGFATFLTALAPATAVADPLKRLKELGRRYIAFGERDPETYRLLFMESPKYSSAGFQERSEAPNSPGIQALAILVGIFDELRAQKRLNSKTDSQTLAETTWAAVHGIVGLKIASHDFPKATAEALLESMLDALINGFVK
ncbi:MAG TPA: TetR/AcrR family transcriptional regulator [Candidatus Baltobacteraceae bacterium]|nr:TetR/AcrR family transcriptional regulator [Candidatus Baltobacteraceae bacterium]